MPALYLRYRPETFQEVIGQAHVTTPLQHALAAGKTHHAYLFSGPRGCGKTTSARILARCLNCAQGPTDTPCGECPSCVELARDGGGSLDVVEIDAASHNGVEDARELRERAAFAPVRDRYKIFILDEAHMVTQQGFNALLKIVEEPPEHVKFIFATTEPEKVLTTIRSRTHHYPFRLVPPGDLLSYLHTVAETEGVELEPGVLALVVKSGGGSVRDTLSLLDQLIAGSLQHGVTLEAAQALLGYTPASTLDEVMVGLSTGNSRATFTALNHLLNTGQDPRRFVEDLLSHLRDIIVIQATSGASEDLFPGVSSDDLNRWGEHAQWFTPQQLTEMAQAVSSALAAMSGVTSPRLHLELLVAQLLSLTTAQDVETTKVSPEHHSGLSQESVAVPTDESANASDSERSPEKSEPPPTDAVEPLSPWDLGVVKSHWPAIIEDLSDRKRSLWVALSATQPLALEGDVITIGFTNRNDGEILKKPQGPGSPLPNADLLREAIYQRTGHRLRFTVGQIEHAPSDDSLSPDAQWPVVSRSTSESPGQAVTEQQERQEVSEEVSESGVEAEASTTPIATRGEPVVRQLLGGELLAEEILEDMSGRGEADV